MGEEPRPLALPPGETVSGNLDQNPTSEARERELLDYDRRHVWHPYGPMPAAVEPLRVESASGARLKLADGREIVDGMSSWWCAIHGYRNPVLDSAAHDQLGRMSHVMFGGLTHEPAIALARRLVEMTPEGLEHVFFADSGSVSVEVAIKMCLQARQGRPEAAGPARRLPRRHLRGDERLRPRRRDALAVQLRPAPAGLRRPPSARDGRRVLGSPDAASSSATPTSSPR